MRRLLAITCLALATLSPTVSAADYIKKFQTTIRYNTIKPPNGWHAVNSGDFGYSDTVYL